MTDERLMRLVNQVWKRLPPCDRHVLRDLVTAIVDDEPEGDHVLGATAPGNIGWPDGLPIPENFDYQVNLTPVKGIPSEGAGRWVIAHEFAHVVLRHAHLGTAIAFLVNLNPPLGYARKDVASLKDWEEDSADFLAYTWGFRDEWRDFLAAFPDAARPRWFVE